MKMMQSLFGSNGKADPVLCALNGAEEMEQAGPWRKLVDRPIGSLTAVGFDRASETMLVTSTKGQSVIDGATGQILYRNRDDDGFDPATLKGTRLDHPADERFDMAGLFGGGLRRITKDGWSTHTLRSHCVLSPPQTPRPVLEGDSNTAPFYLLDRSGAEIRALGFSWTGHTLVVATVNRLAVWNRPAPLKL